MILDRLRALDKYVSPFQCGFRPERGTTEQALALRILDERLFAEDYVITYLDFAKAFDSITHEALESALSAWCVPDDIIRCVMRNRNAPSMHIASTYLHMRAHGPIEDFRFLRVQPKLFAAVVLL